MPESIAFAWLGFYFLLECFPQIFSDLILAVTLNGNSTQTQFEKKKPLSLATFPLLGNVTFYFWCQK